MCRLVSSSSSVSSSSFRYSWSFSFFNLCIFVCRSECCSSNMESSSWIVFLSFSRSTNSLADFCYFSFDASSIFFFSSSCSVSTFLMSSFTCDSLNFIYKLRWSFFAVSFLSCTSNVWFCSSFSFSSDSRWFIFFLNSFCFSWASILNFCSSSSTLVVYPSCFSKSCLI